MESIQLPPSRTYSTWVKYIILAKYCVMLSIADKRYVFATIRQVLEKKDKETDTELYNYYLPKFGITLSEFALFHTISDHVKKTLL